VGANAPARSPHLEPVLEEAEPHAVGVDRCHGVPLGGGLRLPRRHLRPQQGALALVPGGRGEEPPLDGGAVQPGVGEVGQQAQREGGGSSQQPGPHKDAQLQGGRGEDQDGTPGQEPQQALVGGAQGGAAGLYDKAGVKAGLSEDKLYCF
jgi:hypothetical protein